MTEATDTTDRPEDAPTPERVYEPADTIRALVGHFPTMSTGDFVAIRRSGDVTPAFLRVAQVVLEPRGRLAGGEVPIPEQERRWAQVVSLTAQLHARGLLVRDVRAGFALGSFLKEARLNKLLEARGEGLRREARMVVAYAIGQMTKMNFSTLAELILEDGTSRHEEARIRVARDYVRATHQRKNAH